MRWCEDRRTIQNVQYSTISKYTKYTKYTKYSTIVLYTLQYLHVPWFLQPYWTKSSLSALISGVQTCTLLLHCKYWEPWQAESSLSTHMPRGVQIMLCWVPPKSWWDGRYIQNVSAVKFFCIVTSNTLPSQILVRLRKTEFKIKTRFSGTIGERANGYIPVLGQITQG